MNAPTVAAFDAALMLESLRERGAVVSVKGDGAGAWLHVAPRSVLSDGERADLRRHKRELIAALDAPGVATTAHRWRLAATTAPDVAQVRAQLRALDEELGAPLSIRAVVRASRDLDARQTRDTRKQWRALDAARRHAEAVATALLDSGIDPAQVAGTPDEVTR